MKNYQKKYLMSPVLSFKKIMNHTLKNTISSLLKTHMIKMIGKDTLISQLLWEKITKLLEMTFLSQTRKELPVLSTVKLAMLFFSKSIKLELSQSPFSLMK